jgi:hypothetical protein
MRRLVPTVYRHIQETPATTWTIVHNLSGGGALFPIVDVLATIGGNTVKVMPLNVTKIDNNTVEVTFTVAQAGEAVVVA